MSWTFPSFSKQTPLDREIATLLKKMEEIGPENPKYPILMAYVERLDKLRAPEKPKRITRDAIVAGVCQLGVALLIIGYEHRGHVITTKATNMLRRPDSLFD